MSDVFAKAGEMRAAPPVMRDYSPSQQRTLAQALLRRNLSRVNALCAPVVPRHSFYVSHGKRMLDLALALPTFLIALPVNCVLALCTWIDVGRPILFRQERIGMNGKPFVLIKFRNMRELTDANGELLPAKDRVTKFGRFVRRMSLDELLNLWSVLKGDMSIIGPRPMPMEYAERFSARHNQRHLVRPGLECPFLHELNRTATWTDQFENDVWYVENVSLKTDLMLVGKLVSMVFDKKRAKQRGAAIRGSFLGYDERGVVVSTLNVDESLLNECAPLRGA